MKRRRFIQVSAMVIPLAGFPFLPQHMDAAPEYPMGLQLFTIRDAMAADPIKTLKDVVNMGYQDLEIYGYNGEQDLYYGFKSREFKRVLDDLGLTTSSGHYDLPAYIARPDSERMRYVDQCIEGALTLGQSYITWPWLPPEFRDISHYGQLCELLNRIGERTATAGIGFAYHNHGFEFEEQDGITGYEIILKQTDPELVKLQLDLYWVAHSSAHTHAYWIDQAPGRYVMWHIKDMDIETRDYTELGNGSIDFHPILPLHKQAGLRYYYLEKGGNFAQNSMQSIRDSAAFFKAHLQRYL